MRTHILNRGGKEMYQVGLNYIGYTGSETALLKMLEKFGVGREEVFVEDFKLFSEDVKEMDTQSTYFEITTVLLIEERETMEKFLLDLDQSLIELAQTDKLRVKSKTIEYNFLGKENIEEELVQ